MNACAKIDSGDLIVIIGCRARPFAEVLRRNLREELGLSVGPSFASSAPLPELLSLAGAPVVHLIIVERDTPEQRARDLVAFADFVLRADSPNEARIIRRRQFQCIWLGKEAT
jgi:hypothetical protein